MRMFRRLRAYLAAPLAALMVVVSLPLGAAQAGLVPTDKVIDRAAIEADRDRILNLLARDDVRAQIQALGIDADEAAARVAGLSDAEIQTIAHRLDTLPAGQDPVGAIIGAALVIFLVLLVTDVLGLTNVFPFVRR